MAAVELNLSLIVVAGWTCRGDSVKKVGHLPSLPEHICPSVPDPYRSRNPL